MQDSQIPVVLVVDDDPLVRAFSVNIVKIAGYVALEAASADEATAILEDRSDIAVLFSDINLTGSISGLQLARTVSERWPPIKMILVSGKVALTASDMPSDSRFFAKPYEARSMISELRSLVSASAVVNERAD
jgi:DNA-binding NtrC family response regulator